MRSTLPRTLAVCLLAGTAVVCVARPAVAQEHHRIFGVLPNYTTVDEQPAVDAASALGTTTTSPFISTKQSFELASLSSFDPVVFPFVGLTTALGGGSHDSSYRERYERAFADNSIGNFMTTAIVPALTKQDSRYFRSAEGGIVHRLAYAASRSVVTRTRAGRTTFNVSELGGNLAAAGLSNVYYGPADRAVAGTMSRWGSQVMWDTVANELKEFWPDLHAKLLKN
jgi:hypothetical protein